MSIADRDHFCDGGKACMAALQAPDRPRLTEKHGGGTQRKLLMPACVRQSGSLPLQSSDVNAAKHNGRQTDVHTSP